MAEMELDVRNFAANPNSRSIAVDSRELTGSQKIKIQFLGPGAEVALLEGPAAGKRWVLHTQVTINEFDI